MGYVCNPSSSKERDAASRGHTSGIPASGCFIPEADAGSTARAFMLPGRLRHPPVTSRPSVDRLHMCSEHGYAGGVPLASFGRSVSFLRGTGVTYVTQDVFWGRGAYRNAVAQGPLDILRRPCMLVMQTV